MAATTTAVPDPAQQQPEPGLVRRLAKETFDFYVPPHVQARERRLPTWGELGAAFKKHVHVPGLPIRHWARTYTREVRGHHRLGEMGVLHWWFVLDRSIDRSAPT